MFNDPDGDIWEQDLVQAEECFTSGSHGADLGHSPQDLEQTEECFTSGPHEVAEHTGDPRQGQTRTLDSNASASDSPHVGNLPRCEAPNFTQYGYVLVNAPGAVRLTGAPHAAGNEAPLHAAPTQSLLQAAAYQQAQDLLGPGFWLEAASAAVDEDMVSVAESALEDLPTAEKEKALQERTAKAEGRRAEKAKKARVMATVLSQAFDKRRKKTGAVEGA